MKKNSWSIEEEEPRPAETKKEPAAVVATTEEDES